MRYVYLTIDDGPTKYFKKKIDFLSKNKINAIFFCLGHKIKDFEEDVIYAIKKGHIIGNHSFGHSNFSEISLEEARDEIEKCDKIIEEVYEKAGVERKIKAFRFPFMNNGSKDKYGKYDWDDLHVKRIQEILKELKYKRIDFKGIRYEKYKESRFDKCINVDCTFDTMDWTVADGSAMFGLKTLGDLIARMDEDKSEEYSGIFFRDSNEVVMMHDDERILDVFEPLVERLIEKGFGFKIPGKYVR